MEKMITNGKNLLRHCKLGWYFQEPNGTFLRMATSREAEYICQVGHEIDFHFPNPHPEEFPVWTTLVTIQTLADLSAFKPETGSNGGDYAHYQFEDWFVAKVNGKPVFRVVTAFFTSAEFALDNLTGNFQTDLGRLEVVNADRGQQYDTQCQYWDESLGEIVYNTFEVLEKISEIRPFRELWTATTLEICDDESQNQSPALSFHRKKEILAKLKELEIDVDKPASRSSKRKPR